MADKQVVIELEELPNTSTRFKVTRLVNSVDYKIGETLTKAEVQELILHKINTKVVVKPNRKQKR